MSNGAPPPLRAEDIGIVLIGRNEGARLRQALDALPAGVGVAVYVDSGSTDGSVELARSRGVSVVELDLTRPFTAARARNAGFARAVAERPALGAVQFVDGDCALAPDWLSAAMAVLEGDAGCAAVCGWRRERHPEASLYNKLCDLEWLAPPLGDVGEFGFGGDVVIRVADFRAQGGYAEDLIAGEDPELSARLRQAGRRVLRIDRAMTWHDAAIHSLRAYWIRSKRGGHAVAEVGLRHRDHRLFARHLRSIVLWGALVPLLGIAALTFGIAAALLAWTVIAALYGLQIRRIARSQDPVRFPPADARLWGVCCLLSQIPKALGVLQFAWSRLRGRRQRLIEYK
jgi:glycosyltransferase involved in cell wall biosynthesis